MEQLNHICMCRMSNQAGGSGVGVERGHITSSRGLPPFPLQSECAPRGPAKGSEKNKTGSNPETKKAAVGGGEGYQGGGWSRWGQSGSTGGLDQGQGKTQPSGINSHQCLFLNLCLQLSKRQNKPDFGLATFSLLSVALPLRSIKDWD